jgi:hypothetical protein
LHGEKIHYSLNNRSDIVTTWKGISELSEIKFALSRPSKFSFAPDYYIVLSDNNGNVSITPMLSTDKKTYYLLIQTHKRSNDPDKVGKTNEILLETSIDVFSILEALTSSLSSQEHV